MKKANILNETDWTKENHKMKMIVLEESAKRI